MGVLSIDELVALTNRIAQHLQQVYGTTIGKSKEAIAYALGEAKKLGIKIRPIKVKTKDGKWRWIGVADYMIIDPCVEEVKKDFPKVYSFSGVPYKIVDFEPKDEDTIKVMRKIMNVDVCKYCGRLIDLSDPYSYIYDNGYICLKCAKKGGYNSDLEWIKYWQEKGL